MSLPILSWQRREGSATVPSSLIASELPRRKVNMFPLRIGSRIIYGLLAFFAGHYSYVLVAAAWGMWVQSLVPGRNLWSMSGHLLVLVAVWVLFPKKKIVTVALTIGILILFLIVNQFLFGWPTMDLPKFWSILVVELLQCFGAPILVAFLLLNAERIAPKIMRTEAVAK